MGTFYTPRFCRHPFTDYEKTPMLTFTSKYITRRHDMMKPIQLTIFNAMISIKNQSFSFIYRFCSEIITFKKMYVEIYANSKRV